MRLSHCLLPSEFREPMRTPEQVVYAWHCCGKRNCPLSHVMMPHLQRRAFEPVDWVCVHIALLQQPRSCGVTPLSGGKVTANIYKPDHGRQRP